MGAPKWPPYPQRSERPGEAVALLDTRMGSLVTPLPTAPTLGWARW